MTHKRFYTFLINTIRSAFSHSKSTRTTVAVGGKNVGEGAVISYLLNFHPYKKMDCFFFLFFFGFKKNYLSKNKRETD